MWSTFSSKVVLLNISTFLTAAPYPVDLCWRFFLKRIRIWLADGLWIGLWTTLQRNKKFSLSGHFIFLPVHLLLLDGIIRWEFRTQLSYDPYQPSGRWWSITSTTFVSLCPEGNNKIASNFGLVILIWKYFLLKICSLN